MTEMTVPERQFDFWLGDWDVSWLAYSLYALGGKLGARRGGEARVGFGSTILTAVYF